MALVFLSLCFHISAQSTQGLISGKISDEVNLQPIKGAHVALIPERETLPTLDTNTDQNGYFSFASLSPGTYTLRISAATYRPSEVRGLSLAVAGLLVQNVALRLSNDIWQRGITRSVFPVQGAVLPVYGPDVDLSRSAQIEESPEITTELTPSLSKDVTSTEISTLPLQGRDPYALVVLEPNVTNDISTLRGLGVSANGQRPSSTSFLLDGFQNNNYLTTGVLAVLPPEAIQEYRLSINNYSAEFGGTSGYLANVVTVSSSNAWHGETYVDLTNQSWNAVDPGDKLAGGPAPSQQIFAGVVIGGALLKDRVFTTSSFEWGRSHGSAPPESYLLPTENLFHTLQPGTMVAGLLSRFSAPVAPGPGLLGNVTLRPSVSIDHADAVQRGDLNSRENTHSFLRLIVDRLSQPDFSWSPYSAFRSDLDRRETALGAATNWAPRPNRTYEFRMSYSQDSIGWNRAHPEIPLLATQGYTFGSPLSYTFQDRGKTIEVGANLAFTQGRHALRFGASFLERWPDIAWSTPGSPTEYEFRSMQDLVSGSPDLFLFAASRAAAEAGTLAQPDLARSYRYWQSGSYLEDTYRVSDRLILNAGVRHEYFSPPLNVGNTQDSMIQLGPGASVSERVSNATIVSDGPIYASDFKDWAPRIGVAYNIRRNGDLVFRASYGIFYDRPFDNLWLNTALNDAVPVSASVAGLPLNPFVNPANNIVTVSHALNDSARQVFRSGCLPPTINLGAPPNVSVAMDCASIDQTFFQPGFRSPYVQSFFGGLQKRVTDAVLVEAEYTGAVGHELLTTDILNRQFPCTFVGQQIECPNRDNPQFGDLDYRANQGSSSHHALLASLSVRHRSLTWMLNYTWSHTIDNQSEPLEGFAANLAEVNLTSRSISPHQAAFTQEYNSSADRGNSDFDQRQTLTSYFTWFAPRAHIGKRIDPVLRNWYIAGVAAVRSGSPFTVYALNDTSAGLFNNRANLVDPFSASADIQYPGGKVILNASAFSNPADGVVGTSGRNAFYGPGAYNVDLSIGRSFKLHSERWQLTTRFDAFNALNHANLSNPTSIAADCCGGEAQPPFGFAAYGRSEANTGLPAATPLRETARQLHFVVRLAF